MYDFEYHEVYSDGVYIYDPRKKAYMDWSEKGVSYLNCMCVYDIMMDVDEALQTCDTILDEIDLGIDYTSRKKQS